jgi:hypothetical protein
LHLARMVPRAYALSASPADDTLAGFVAPVD